MRGFVTIDYILDRLYRDYGFPPEDVHKTDVAEWVTDVLRRLPIKEVYQEKGHNCGGSAPVYIDIDNYKGELPCDFFELIDLRIKDTTSGLDVGTDTFFKSSRPSFQSSNSDKIRYQIMSPYIYTDTFKEGQLEIVYLGMPTDNEGLPLVIDIEQVISTVMSFVAYRIAFKLSIQGRFVEQKKEELKDMYIGNMRSCPAYLRTPTFKQALNILAHSTGIHTRTNAFDTNFKDFGEIGR